MLHLSIIQPAIAKNMGFRLELDGEMISISYVYFFFERLSRDFVDNLDFLFHDYIITRKKGFVNPLFVRNPLNYGISVIISFPNCPHIGDG